MPALSVIILTCNRPDRCADSVLHNARELDGLDAEIVLINNGGPPVHLPETPASVPVRRLDMPNNTGVAARNTGAALAGGESLLFLDDDAYIKAPAVCAMLSVLREPGIGAVAFRIQGSAEEEACLLPTVFHGCACGFNRSALLGVGGYPDHFLYYGEEYDLAFRLHRAGYGTALLTGSEPVRHVRDSAGRSIDRIIFRLVRNNAFLLTAYLPWRHVPAAMRDTFQRYRAVATKESAARGWRCGMAAAPAAALRALFHRQPLAPSSFAAISMKAPMAEIAGRLAARDARKVVLCGVGKFPSLWQAVLRRHGVTVEAFVDFNTCWRGQRVNGVPVFLPEDNALPAGIASHHWVTGLASRPDNRRWREMASRGGRLVAVIGLREKRAAGVPVELLNEPEVAFFAA